MYIGDSSASVNYHEEEIDGQPKEALLMENPDRLIGLRHLNSNDNDGFSIFWKQCESFLLECTTVHERRHGNATLAHPLSVRDLVEQVRRQCPEGTPIPSLQWASLHSYPKNPHTKVASLYRKRLPVKMMVQKRQFRKPMLTNIIVRPCSDISGSMH